MVLRQRPYLQIRSQRRSSQLSPVALPTLFKPVCGPSESSALCCTIFQELSDSLSPCYYFIRLNSNSSRQEGDNKFLFSVTPCLKAILPVFPKSCCYRSVLRLSFHFSRFPKLEMIASSSDSTFSGGREVLTTSAMEAFDRCALALTLVFE